jgi:hypothetical protein
VKLAQLNKEYPPQKCSYCKGLIFHPDIKIFLIKYRPEYFWGIACHCSELGEYYIPSGIISDSAGISHWLNYNNYLYTKIDQEHFF